MRHNIGGQGTPRQGRWTDSFIRCAKGDWRPIEGDTNAITAGAVPPPPTASLDISGSHIVVFLGGISWDLPWAPAGLPWEPQRGPLGTRGLPRRDPKGS